MSTEIITIRTTYQRRNIDGGDGPSGYSVNNFVPHTIHNSVNNSAQNLDWRDDIKNGNCATTFLTGIKESLTRTPCSFSISSSHGDFCRGEDISNGLPWRSSDPSPLSVTLADSLARSKLIAKANEYQRPFTGGVALGELRETLRMIKNPAASLFNSLNRHLKSASSKMKGAKRGTEHYRKTASGLWLESVFGWVPLFSDIDSAAKALSQLANNASKRRKLIVGFGEDRTVIDNDLGEILYGSADIRCLYAYRQENNVSVKYRAMLQWDNSYYSKFRYFGLTPESILPTAWELVPWSFLIDYFTNVGEIIEGFSFGTQRLRWVDRGEMKLSLRTFRSRSYYFDMSPLPGEGWFTPESIVSSRRTVRREQVLNFTPVPDFRFEVPGSRQFANMAALLSNKRGLF